MCTKTRQKYCQPGHCFVFNNFAPPLSTIRSQKKIQRDVGKHYTGVCWVSSTNFPTTIKQTSSFILNLSFHNVTHDLLKKSIFFSYAFCNFCICISFFFHTYALIIFFFFHHNAWCATWRGASRSRELAITPRMLVRMAERSLRIYEWTRIMQQHLCNAKCTGASAGVVCCCTRPLALYQLLLLHWYIRRTYVQPTV